MITKLYLEREYLLRKRSVASIAGNLRCSQNKVTYWIQKHNIQKRTIADALYIHHNPKGDPFMFTSPKNHKEYFLYGLGLGLFWGEGNKVNKNSVRLGNTDPGLLRFFLQFLYELYHIDKKKIRVGLQLFNDINPAVALNYWVATLGLSKEQFQKPVITRQSKMGTYRNKSKYGVVTIYFSNTKLRDSIMLAITELQKGTMPS